MLKILKNQIAIHQSMIDGIRKVFKNSVYTCAFTLDVITTISAGLLPDINPISSVTVEISWFSSISHRYMFHWTCTKQKFQHQLVQM